MNGQNHSLEKKLLNSNSEFYKDSVNLKFYNKESSKLYKEKKYKKGLVFAKKEVSLLEKYKVNSKKYTKALYKVAYLYYLVDSLDKSLKLHEKVTDLNLDIIQSGKSYCEIGRIYGKYGELQKSIFFYEKGIDILEKNKSSGVYNKYLHLTHTYYNLGNPKYYTTAIDYLKKAQKIADENNFDKGRYFDLNKQFSVFYSLQPTYNFKKSKKYNLKNFLISKEDSYKLANIYNNLALLYVNEKKDSAEFFIKKGLKLSSEKIIKARLYDNYSDFYFHKSDFKNALKNIDKATEINLDKENSVEFLITEADFIKSIEKTHLIHCLQRKSKILIELYKKEKDISYLKRVVQNVKIVDKFVQFILQDMSEQQTKLHWIKKASQAYFYGIEAAYLLKENSVAFSFMEKNKALLLIESIARNVEQTKLPYHVILKNNNFQKTILALESKLKNQNFISDSLFNVKQDYDKFKDSIRITYSEYFKNKFNSNKIQLSEVQNNLKEKEVVVSYIWNKSDEEQEAVFGQYITKNNAEVFKINDIDSLKIKLKEYKDIITKPFETEKNKKHFLKVSYNLFRILFPDKKVKDLLINKNITIIPDGKLHNIPFDALITKENTFDYLLNSNTISYVYSMSFSNQNNKIKRETNNDYLGYAPVTFSNQNLENLSYTANEVSAVQNKLGGDTVLNENARKQHFLTQSNTSKIIHLATHADASNNPWIAFADEKLELHELYTYKNNADLVVLSACNTSLGEIVQGEGVLSLARGFFYSGAKSVVSSLWNVNDKSTSFIMSHFYENLKLGQTKSLALTNAKRTYLKTHSLSEKSPYYWASFVLIGDVETIDFTNNNYLYFGLLAVLIIGLYLYLKKIKNVG